MPCLRIPKAVEEILNQIMRRFFWIGTREQHKFPLISLSEICSPKEVGGVGIRHLLVMNLAMGAKLVWNSYTNGNKKWIKILRRKYLDLGELTPILTTRDPPRGSAIWNYIMECKDIITKHITWELSNSQSASFWMDSSEGMIPIANHPNLEAIKVETILVWGSKVSNYGAIIEQDGVCNNH